MDNVDFLKKFMNFFKEVNLLKEDKIIGVRYRKKGQVLNFNIGKMLLENESFGGRRFGFIVLVQRDFIEKIQKNRSFVEKYKLNVF